MAGFEKDTIFALSSGSPPAGVAVIRVSGPETATVVKGIAGSIPEANEVRYAKLIGHSGERIDTGLVLYFRRPKSFTGEDCAEFQVHGSRAVVKRVLAELERFDGCRPAEPGEFTLRAFLNGRIDLTGAEALADLVAAETEEQRRFAIENSLGKQKHLYEEWRSLVIQAMAELEATLDFADEEDAPSMVNGENWTKLQELAEEIDSHAKRFEVAEIIREGFQVAIVGAPNAGKSSLLNMLAGREAAIVTSVPGTTRDIVQVDLDLEGLLVKLYDTAGLRETDDPVERIGVERAKEVAGNADLVILLEDLTSGGASTQFSAPSLKVGNKVDIAGPGPHFGFDLAISAVSGEGIAQLLKRIVSLARKKIGHSEVVPFRRRHLEHLKMCANLMRQAANSGTADELRAEDLRVAASHLGRITGIIDVEDLLDSIFSRFCIGK